MNNHQPSPLLGWANYYHQGKSMEELRNCVVYSALELENTKLAVQAELRKRDDQLRHLKDLLSKAFRERDEANEKCRRLVSEKLLLQHQNQTGLLPGIATDEPGRGIDSNSGFSSSDCSESIVSSPATDPVAGKMEELVAEKPLPEKGKLLQAVMEAGPLLQTLLLAGPLPQWRHPPPPLKPFDVPPMTIPSPPPELLRQQSSSLVNGSTDCGRVNRKRILLTSEVSDSAAAETKSQRQRVLLH